MTQYEFTNNWFGSPIKSNWDFLLPRLKPLKVLEIGSYEGASACHLIENLGHLPNFELHCIDTWEGGIENKLANIDMKSVESRFFHNIQVALNKNNHPVRFFPHKGYSDVFLPQLIQELGKSYFDFIYIDGSHQAPDVLFDAVCSFKLLRVGGMIIFDDYFWSEALPGGKDPIRCPKIAIDAFINIYIRKLDIFQATPQMAIRKIAD